MGAWNADSFGNDTALDFAANLSSMLDLEDAFAELGAKVSWVESDTASEAIAAAEIVAALLGRVAPDLPQSTTSKIETFGQPTAALVASAIAAVEYIQTNSELADLWAEAGSDDWLSATTKLLNRLDVHKDFVPSGKPSDYAAEADVHAACIVCGQTIPAANVVTLTISETSSVWFSTTNYAHSSCLEKEFTAPHFSDDGTPHTNLMAQYRAFMGY